MALSDSQRPFSQIIEFTVVPRHQAGLVASLIQQTERFTRTYPGFVSATVEVSEDGERVINQVLWQSKSAFEQALENAEAGAQNFYAMLREHRVTAATFNTYHIESQILSAR